MDPDLSLPGAVHALRSADYLSRAWYPVCWSSQLAKGPISRMLQDIPLVLFRDQGGQPAALLDRCPHRNVPLSLGVWSDGALTCAYHGWRFDGSGQCLSIPMLARELASRPCVRRFSAVERGGLVWVCVDPNPDPPPPPVDEVCGYPPQAGTQEKRAPCSQSNLGTLLSRLVGDTGYVRAQLDAVFDCNLADALENSIDVPHTAYLHRGLFRASTQSNDISAVITCGEDWVQSEYLNEPRPTGLIGRIVAPQGGLLTHVDRFTLPCTLRVEYRLGQQHLLTQVFCSPISRDKTALFVVLRLKAARALRPVLRLLIGHFGRKVLAQDVAITREQTQAVQRFGGEHFASTELDTFALQIRRLLVRAARGKVGKPARYEVRLRT